MKCRICGTDGYGQTYYEPEEPCMCGHRVSESPWSYAGWRGVMAWFKYSVIAKLWYKVAEPINNWIYKEWDF